MAKATVAADKLAPQSAIVANALPTALKAGADNCATNAVVDDQAAESPVTENDRAVKVAAHSFSRAIAAGDRAMLAAPITALYALLTAKAAPSIEKAGAVRSAENGMFDPPSCGIAALNPW